MEKIAHVMEPRDCGNVVALARRACLQPFDQGMTFAHIPSMTDVLAPTSVVQETSDDPLVGLHTQLAGVRAEMVAMRAEIAAIKKELLMVRQGIGVLLVRRP